MTTLVLDVFSFHCLISDSGCSKCHLGAANLVTREQVVIIDFAPSMEMEPSLCLRMNHEDKQWGATEAPARPSSYYVYGSAMNLHGHAPDLADSSYCLH